MKVFFHTKYQSHKFSYNYIHLNFKCLYHSNIWKKNFKDKKISTFLQKSVLFFILFLHLKIFISITRSCIDMYITFGKFHTYLNTYADSIFKHSNIWKKNFKHKKMSTFLQKSVLFFILFLHLKIFISIIRSCIDLYITFGKFHTYLYTYEDSIFKHSNI